MTEEVFTYRDGNDWVSYIESEEGICMSAHTDSQKYPKPMLRAILKTFLQFDSVYTILPYNYLVKFYKQHAEVELINAEANLYRLWRVK